MSHKVSEQAQLAFEEDFKGWLDHPTTKKLLSYMRSQIQDRKDAWANGEMVSSFSHEQFIREAVAKGYISAFQEVLTIEAKDLESHE